MNVCKSSTQSLGKSPAWGLEGHPANEGVDFGTSIKDWILVEAKTYSESFATRGV